MSDIRSKPYSTSGRENHERIFANEKAKKDAENKLKTGTQNK